MFFKIGVLRNFAIFTGKHEYWSFYLVRFQATRPATLLKETPETSVFMWILQYFLGQLFYGTPQVAASVDWWSRIQCILHATILFQTNKLNNTTVSFSHDPISCQYFVSSSISFNVIKSLVYSQPQLSQNLAVCVFVCVCVCVCVCVRARTRAPVCVCLNVSMPYKLWGALGKV